MAAWLSVASRYEPNPYHLTHRLALAKQNLFSLRKPSSRVARRMFNIGFHRGWNGEPGRRFVRYDGKGTSTTTLAMPCKRLISNAATALFPAKWSCQESVEYRSSRKMLRPIVPGKASSVKIGRSASWSSICFRFSFFYFFPSETAILLER